MAVWSSFSRRWFVGVVLRDCCAPRHPSHWLPVIHTERSPGTAIDRVPGPPQPFAAGRPVRRHPQIYRI